MLLFHIIHTQMTFDLQTLEEKTETHSLRVCMDTGTHFLVIFNETSTETEIDYLFF